MKLPVLNGIIDRRILINYSVEPEVVSSLLPTHLRPLVVNGYASGGICLIRLKHIGLKYTPSIFRITSENAAYRFLVTCKDKGGWVRGVYIPRRTTDSWLNVVVAGKLFAWPHYPARFESTEDKGRYSVRMGPDDGPVELEITAHRTDDFPEHSMFRSLAEASLCFANCNLGISPATHSRSFKTICLETSTWSVAPLVVDKLCSAYFSDTRRFPKGSIAFDNALLMEGIQHAWRET